MLLGTLAASILGSTLTRKGILRVDEGVIRVRYKFLMPSHPLTNFVIVSMNQ